MKTLMLKVSLRCLSFSLLFAAGAEAAPAPYPEKVFPALEPLIEQALAQSPALERHSYRVDEAEGNAMAARSARLPSVRSNAYLQGRYEYIVDSQVQEGEELDAVIFGNVTLTQPLYHFGALEATSRAGKIRLAVARSEYREQLREVVFDVRDSFLQLLLARQSLEITRENLDLAQQHAKSQENLFDQGTVSETAMLESRLLAEEAREAVLGAENGVQYYESQLANLLGVHDRYANVEEAGIPEIEPLTEEQLQTLADRAVQTETFSEEQAELNLKAQKEVIKTIEARTLPRLDFVTGLNTDVFEEYRRTTNDYESVPRVIGFAGFAINWNIFDGFETRGRKIAAKARQREAEFALTQAEREKMLRAQGFVRELAYLGKRMENRDRRLEARNRQLELDERLFEDEMLARNEILRRRLQAARDRESAFRARVEYMLKLAEFNDRFGLREEHYRNIEVK